MTPSSATVAALLAGLLLSVTGTPAAADNGLDFFESKIRPVLVANCYACHSAEAKTRMGGLSLDTRDGIQEGGQRGHAVVPEDVESSLILSVLRYDGDLKMPPGGRLPDEVVSDFERWIRMGAPDPRETEVKESKSTIDLERGRGYWAFQTPRRPDLPRVADIEWPRGTIDQLVLASLEQRGLRPAQDASKADLLRRVTFDLTGLPPTAEELQAFVDDRSEHAYAKVVDRLLESDRFGERWGRHWLDVVRYADTVGRTRNLPFPVAWKYRDYVIESFNKDKPFDRFIREQVAGDLLPYDSASERVENQIATGFLAIGAHDLNEPDAKQFDMDVADEMINVSTRSFLALSVGCARCHDHKFDPIPTTDYYALAGIFRSSDLRSGLRRRPRFNAGYFRTHKLIQLDGVPEFTSANAGEVRAERERLWKALQAAEKAGDRAECRKLARALGKLPLPENLAMGVVEAPKPAATRVNVGGDPHALGVPVDRGFVQVLYPEQAELPQIGNRESGRLQLADWLTRRDNPLTARVMANRVWRHMLGTGIVATVDNFGAMGRQPVNQGLLDYLAVQFTDQEWSVKSLVREVALSRTYRLASSPVEANLEIDPDNDYFWRANVRRLEAESVRDSVLLVSGELRTGAPPPSPVHGFDRNQLINTGNRQVSSWEIDETYRSVYVPVIRNQASRLFEAFDFPEPSETHGDRDVTTSPTQALFLMNSAFVSANADVAAERLLAAVNGDAQRVRQAFRQALSREPSPQEVDAALGAIRDAARELASSSADRSGRVAARAWVDALASAALERTFNEDEIASAMDYIERHQPEAGSSVESAARAFLDSDGVFRRGRVLGMLQSALGWDLTRPEKAAALKKVREWWARAIKTRATGEWTTLASAGSPEQEAWSLLYHALYNSAEFRYRF